MIHNSIVQVTFGFLLGSKVGLKNQFHFFGFDANTGVEARSGTFAKNSYHTVIVARVTNVINDKFLGVHGSCHFMFMLWEQEP